MSYRDLEQQEAIVEVGLEMNRAAWILLHLALDEGLLDLQHF